MLIKAGVNGIIASNHGGRTFDCAISPVDVIEELSHACKDKLELYFDSGIRCGSDIFKVLALGSKAALLGRPILYAVALAGEQGVVDFLEGLKEELENIMMLSGVKDVRHTADTSITRL